MREGGYSRPFPKTYPRVATMALQHFSSEARCLSNIGKFSECFFSCGGTVPGIDNVKIVYKGQHSGQWSSLQLPVDMTCGAESMKEFLEACSVAGFGVGGANVTDKEFYDALKLDPEHFCVDFEVASSTILNDIRTTMSAGSSVRAEPCKLNVYATGGHFKAHVDTPQSNDMFGSLVVCLPSVFTGGALITRHQGREATFDWSLSPFTLHWAAFYCGVEHEILPVMSGHRITLTYNLYYSQPIQPQSFDVSICPLFQELLAALQTPHFMKEGGKLGFFCHYQYTDDKYSSVSKDFLKGEDMIVYQVAKSLGLSVNLKLCKWRSKDYAVSQSGYRESDILIMDGGETDERLFGHRDTSIKNLCWCWSSKRELPLHYTLSYGNEPVIYWSAALLVEVPEFTSDQRMDLISNGADSLQRQVLKKGVKKHSKKKIVAAKRKVKRGLYKKKISRKQFKLLRKQLLRKQIARKLVF